MTILVDAGSSALKLAMHEGQSGISWLASIPYEGRSAADCLTGWLAQRQGKVPMLVSNVLGESFAIELTAWCAANGWPVPKFVNVIHKSHGLRVGYLNPGQLGVDRYVVMVGALQAVRPPFVLADCGTAVTIDAVDAGGRHRGGIILPGLRLMRQSLTKGAGLNAGGVPRLFADNTGDGIEGGIHAGLAGAIDRIAGDMVEAIGESRYLLTGGDAEVLRPFLARDWLVDPMLVMRGLAILAGET